MRRDFSNFHTSTIPAAFLHRPTEEINPPSGPRAMAGSILRSLNRLRRRRVAYIAIVIALGVGMVVRYRILNTRKSLQVSQEAKEDVQNFKLPESAEKPKIKAVTEEKPKTIQAKKGATEKPLSSGPEKKGATEKPLSSGPEKTEVAEEKPHSPTQGKKQVGAAERTPSSTQKQREAAEVEKPPSVTQTPLILPNALIIGAAFCGTNPLADLLSLHPNIAVTRNPLRFFTENYGKGLRWYSSMLMKPNTRQYVIIERSPDYLYSGDAPERVKKMNSSMKIIVVLRSPKRRLVSEYVATVLSKLSEEEAKEQTIGSVAIDPATELVDALKKIITNGIYLEHIQRWLDKFPLAQFHFVDGDDFIRNPLQELNSLEQFLGVPYSVKEEDLHFNGTSGYFCPKHEGKPRCYGHSAVPQNLKEDDVETLVKIKLYYLHHNEKLFNLIHRRFTWF